MRYILDLLGCPDMPHFMRNNGEIYYDQFGRGDETVLLLQGLSRSAAYWNGFDRLLAQQFKVVVIDFSGMGQSSCRPHWGLTIEDLSYEVLALLEHLEISKINVIGHSLGGMVAMNFAALYPQRVLSLILMNTSIGGDWSQPRVYLSAAAKILAGSVCYPMRFKAAVSIAVGDGLSREAKDLLEAKWRELGMKESIAVQDVAKQLLAAIKYCDKGQLREINSKTTIVVGEGDKFVPPENSHKIAALIEGSKLISLKGVGHEIFLEEPEEMFAIVKSSISLSE